MGAGVCGGAPYNQILNRYGSQFAKLVLAEKAKQVIGDRFQKFTGETNNIYSNFESQVTNLTDQNSSKLKESFEGAKKNINDSVPGGIAVVERLKGQSINELLGYNSALGSLENIKNQVVAQASNKKSEVLNQINSKKQAMIQRVDQEKPSVPIYDSLPEPLQREVLKRGSQTFADQIEQNKGLILQQVAQQFSLQGFSQFLGGINVSNSLQQLVDQFTGGLYSKISALLGLGGGFGNNNQMGQMGMLGQLAGMGGQQNGNLIGNIGAISNLF